MKCEKCGTEEKVLFQGWQCSYGEHPNDCENTEENLPGGYAWLCEDCSYELWLEDCDYQQQV